MNILMFSQLEVWIIMKVIIYLKYLLMRNWELDTFKTVLFQF